MPIELRMHGAVAVAAKVRPDDPDAAARLVAERELLTDLDLPGLVRPTDDPVTDEPALLLEVAGTSTLATARPSAAEVRAIGAQLADTISAMHERGVTHQAVEAEHVLWSPGGDAVLCGVGSASHGGDATKDVEALEQLLLALAPDDASIADAISRSTGDLRRLGTELRREASVGPRLPATSTGRPEHRAMTRPAGPWRPRRLAVTISAAGAAILAALAAALLVRTGNGDDAQVAEPAPTTRPTTTVVTTSPPTTLAATEQRVWPIEPDCPEPAEVTGEVIGTADVDLDGCVELVGRQGTVLDVGDRRFELGVEGDHVVLGDWSCDGLTTPSLVSALDGAVHPFPAWPDDEPLDVPAVAVVGEVASVTTVTDGGCDVLLVELADGTSREITW